MKALADGTDNWLNPLLWYDVSAINLAGPCVRHIVAPHHYQRQCKPAVHSGLAHLLGMAKIALLNCGEIILHSVNDRKWMPVQQGSTAVPLGKGIDLQHIESLPGPCIQILDPLRIADVCKRAPAGVGQPEEMLPIPQKMGAVLRNLQTHCPALLSSNLHRW